MCIQETQTKPPYDKTNKMAIHPAKTQISLGICLVWSESSLSGWRKLGSLVTHWVHSEDSDRLGGCQGWSESALVAQSLCWFCHEAAQTIVPKGFTLKRNIQMGASNELQSKGEQVKLDALLDVCTTLYIKFCRHANVIVGRYYDITSFP